MSRRKITEDIHLLWQRHDNAEATIEKLQEWPRKLIQRFFNIKNN